MSLLKNKEDLKDKGKQQKELANIIDKMEKAGINKKEIENTSSKLKKLLKAGITKEHLNTISHLLIFKSPFRYKFNQTALRRMSRLLAEFGVDITLKLEQPPRNAESPETAGCQFPQMAVDPMGRWVAQAGEMSSHGAYRFEIYELKDDTVFYHHMIEIPIKGDIITTSSYNQVKGLTFNQDGSILWISLGNNPMIGPYKTWLVKINTKDWTHAVYGPVHPYNYLNMVYSHANFFNLKVIKDRNTEKIIAPMLFYQKTIITFDPTKPSEIEPWEINTPIEGLPNFFMRFTDIAISENLLFAAGWAENAETDGITNPRASLIVLNLNNRSIAYGPHYIPEMMGYYDYYHNIIAPLKLRLSKDGISVYLIAEYLTPLQKGGMVPDHTGFAFLNFKTGERWLRDTFPSIAPGLKEQRIRDVLELGTARYLKLYKRDELNNIWHGLIKLDENLNPTEIKKKGPEDWWPQIYAEPHPTRSNDAIMSAVRNIYHPNLPTGIISIWEGF
jgi:hypothetical protein